MGNPTNTVKMRSDDRIIVLKPREGATLSSQGLVDNRLFTGDNKLHAKLNKQNMFWTLNYDSGILPAQLRSSFTSFDKMLNSVKNYFSRRNIDVVEIQD